MSGKIKEFAFIEFEQKSSVERCISAFRQFDGVINSSYEANKIQSVTTYLKEQDELDQQKHEDVRNDKKDGDVKPSSATELSAMKSEANGDLECATDISDVDSLPSIASQPPPPAKRAKLMSEAEESTGENESATERSNGTAKEALSVIETDGDGEKQDDDADFDEEESHDDLPGKRRRRKRRKRRNIVRSSHSPELVQHAQIVEENQMESLKNSLKLLRVATKIEWKRLRNKYLALQREQYAQLKKIYVQQQPASSKYSKKASTLPPLPRPVTIKSKQPPSKQICTRNINFYGANDDQNTENGIGAVANEDPNLFVPAEVIERKKSTVPATAIAKKPTTIAMAQNLSKDPLFEYEPGLIVKVSFDEPCIDVSDFKAEMKQYAFVRYVDLKGGQMSAYVRVDSPHSAPHLIKHCAPRRCQILAGDVEIDYWKKIANDREAKLTKAVKMPKVRDKKMKNVLRHFTQTGKIVNVPSATNHIRFED